MDASELQQVLGPVAGWERSGCSISRSVRSAILIPYAF
jgi:hypothetical protein